MVKSEIRFSASRMDFSGESRGLAFLLTINEGLHFRNLNNLYNSGKYIVFFLKSRCAYARVGGENLVCK